MCPQMTPVGAQMVEVSPKMTQMGSQMAQVSPQMVQDGIFKKNETNISEVFSKLKLSTQGYLWSS